MQPIHRRLIASFAALGIVTGPSCVDVARVDEVTTVRVLGITTDQPYAAPGDEVTLRMTMEDAREPSARPIQITWIAGCKVPTASTPYFACLDQLAGLGAGLGDPKAAPFIHQEVVDAELSGVPDAITFAVEIPEDLLQTKDDVPLDTLVYRVFFTVCAGEIAPEDLAPEGDTLLPVGCFDADGNRIGPDGFVIGFSDVFVFSDGRRNENPQVTGIELDGTLLPQDPTEALAVTACDEPPGGCSGKELPCMRDVEVVVEDTAEPDPSDSTDRREIVWVDYFTDAGNFEEPQKLVSDAATGFKSKHGTPWQFSNEHSGLITIWAVVRDNRGGAAVTHGFLRLQ